MSARRGGAGPGVAGRLAAGGLALGLALGAAPARAQKEPPPPVGEPAGFTLPEAHTFTLDNGARVTLAPYGAIPKVVAQLVVRTGNIDEGPDEAWLADLTGDLMKEGTQARTGEEVAREAARMGGAIDVTVAPDATTVGGDALAEFAPDLIALLAETAITPALPASELERLVADRVRQVTIARTQPQQIALETFRRALYADHPYGQIFPTEAMLRSYTLERVRGFHARNFGAARAHLFVAGRFDAAAVEAAARAALAGWAAGSPPTEREPAPESERVVHLIDRPGAVQSTIYLGLPVVDPSDPDEYRALGLANTLLGGSFQSRIIANIREDKGYTYSPFSQVSSRYRDAYWVQVADVTTAVTGPALTEILKEIDRLRNEPPSAEELEGFQNYLAGTFVLTNATPGGIIQALRFLDLHGLDRSYLTDYVATVYATSPERVSEMARRYIDPSRMVLVVVGDDAQIREQVASYGPIEGEATPPLRRE